VTPPRSITRLALDQARAAAPPAPGRTLRIRINGRLTNCCPDCGVPLTTGACPGDGCIDRRYEPGGLAVNGAASQQDGAASQQDAKGGL
jgi:hypothetical protein